MELLRDLWSVIDHTSPIGRPSTLILTTRARHDAEACQRLQAQTDAALAEARALRAANRPLTKRLKVFLRGVDIPTGTRGTGPGGTRMN
jgi:hypothetical protein